jgi:CBS domain containing-hemolysin-like protein
MNAVLAVAFTGSDTAMLLAIVFLILLATLLSVAETAMTRVTRVRAQALLDEGQSKAKDLIYLVEHHDRWLNPLLFTILVCQLVQATLTGVLANRLFGGWGIAIATFINVVLVFVIAEAAPKTWAIQHTDRAALWSAKPVRLMAAFWPLRMVSRGLIGLTNVILPGKGLKQGPYVTEEQILALAEAAVEEEVLEEGERELIHSIIEFGDTIVRDVMVPRPDMVTVDSDFRVQDAMEVVLLNGYSRVPVCGESADDVVGIVFAKDLMRAERDKKNEEPISRFMRSATFVPETKRIAELLKEMQAEQFHIAMVIDEYGDTAGLVTLEDLIEELVGEIVDEFDREEPMIEPLADGGVRVHARMPVDEVNDILKAELPEGDWTTVGGLMLHLLGHVPVEGETVSADGHLLRAERVQGRRIGRVRITATPSEDAEQAS